MIRFACPGCQKTLNAPDDKAGIKLPCPGCKTVVQVPGAGTTAVGPRPAGPSAQGIAPRPTAPSALGTTPAASAGDDAPPRTFKQRFLSESGAIALATFLQTIRPISYVFSVARCKKLRRKAADAQFVLGQRMYELKIGDKTLAAKIGELGERVHNIQAVRGDAREAVAERKSLITKMAEPALARDKVPESIQGEHERARSAKAKFQEQEHSLAGALGGLLPPDGIGWRRIIVGYTMTLGFMAVFGYFYVQSAQEASRVADRRAKEQASRQKDADDDTKWATKKDTEEIVSLCGPSVALIRFKDGKLTGGGTGFMIRPGILATNAHVVDDVLDHQLKIYFPSSKEGGKTPHGARILYFEPKRDLALLAVEPKVPPLRLAKEFEFKSGMNITVIGCPGVGEKQLENAVNTGNLSTKTEVDKQPFYQLGISVNPGNSGGPVFDKNGQVIGVVTLKASQEGISYCIPWADLKDRLDKIEQDDPARTAALARSSHQMNVVLSRSFAASRLYMLYMGIIAGAMQGRSPQDGFALARNVIDSKFGNLDQQMLNSEIRGIAARLPSDPNLPADVRQKYTVAWNLCEEMRGMVEKPAGNAAHYFTKAREFSTKMKNEVIPFIQSLGYDPNADDDPEKDAK